MAYVWPFLIYLLVTYVISYVIVEFGQRFYYDEVTPYVALKVLGGAVIMAVFLTWTRSSFETMFTADVARTALTAIAWAGVFILIYRFQPLHGALIALGAVLLVPGIATIAVDSLTKTQPDPRTQFTTPSKALRKGTAVNVAPIQPPAK